MTKNSSFNTEYENFYEFPIDNSHKTRYYVNVIRIDFSEKLQSTTF